MAKTETYWTLRGHALAKKDEQGRYFYVNKTTPAWVEDTNVMRRMTLEDGVVISELQAKALYHSWFPKGKWVPRASGPDGDSLAASDAS